MKAFIHRINVWLADLDRRYKARFGVAQTPGWPRTLAIVVTRSGDGLPFLIVLAAIFLLTGPAARSWVLVLVVGDMLTFLVIQVLKYTVRRPRPPGKWGELYRKTDPHSFPSGHAARGGVTAMTAVLLGPAWVTVLLVLWGVGVAFSRVAMGVHYVSDIVAGFLTGAGVAVLVSLLVLV